MLLPVACRESQSLMFGGGNKAGSKGANAGSSADPVGSGSMSNLLANLQGMSLSAPVKKTMRIRLNHHTKVRQCSWYDPCDAAAMDAMVRAACGIPATQQYLLLDDEMAAVALSSSLPSGLTFEVATVPPPAGAPNAKPAAVVVVDPISTGIVLAYQLHTHLGLAVIAVWSDVMPDELKAFVDPRFGIEFAGKIQHGTDSLAATVAAVRSLGYEIRECMVGCETGVLLGDQLSEALGVRTNGTALSGLRRNKFLQTEAVRARQLNACGQMLADTHEDVERFLREKPKADVFKAVVKPVEGAGSDGVFICNSPDEVRKAYASLEGTKNVLGLTNYSVLLQEYLRGDEYVVDTVSRSGVHKCVAIWKYDKRMFNGSPVVYFGMRLLPIDAEPILAAMVEYIFGVLEALGIRNGAIHSEVKMEERGPVLIEANCRLHGGEGTWAPMAEACLGYSAVSAMIDSYLDPLAFAALPRVPENFRAHAKEAKIRSAVAGFVTEIDPEALKAIRSLASYQSEMIGIHVGSRVEKTIDLLTSCGNVNLANASLSELEADYTRFHEIVGRGIFKVRDRRSVDPPEEAAADGAAPVQ